MSLVSTTGLNQDAPTETASDFIQTSPTQTEIVATGENAGGDLPTPTNISTDETTPVVSSTAPVSTDPSLVPDTPTPESISAQPVPTVTLYGDFSVDEVIVKFRQQTEQLNINQCLDTAEATIDSQLDELGSLLLKVPAGKVAEAIAVLLTCPGIRYAEPNYLAWSTDKIPNDPNWGIQYGLLNIRAPQGWDITTGSASVTIAIIDTGVDLGHPDLAAKLVPGYDFVNDDAVPQDDSGHGTHVAGIAAASSDNGTGVAGVSWGARIMPIKVLNASGGGTYANTAAGIIWAADHGAQVINLSLGGSSPSSVLMDAVNYAYGKGVVLVAAAGNSGGNLVLYPAHYSNVIAVVATDGSNHRAGFSNYGPEVDLAAPGVSIYSTAEGGYGYDSGTSMAAPFVSGLAAILRGVPGNGSADAIAWQMESTALDVEFAGWDTYTGYGLIQMDAALQLVIPPTATPTRTFTPLPVLAGGETQPFAPGGFFDAAATSTSTITLYPSPTTTATLLIPSVLPTISTIPGIHATALPEEQEYEVQAQDLPAWQLPCAGMAFLLGGLLLLWAARREQQEYRFSVRRNFK